MKNRFFLFYFLCFVLISCSQKEGYLPDLKAGNPQFVFDSTDVITPIEYLNWAEKTYKQKTTLGNITYELCYMPVEGLLLRNGEYTDMAAFRKDLKENDINQYFILKISINDFSGDPLKYGITTENEYYARVEHLSFGIKDEVYITEGSDTLQCTLNTFERNYNVGPYITEMFTFDKISEGNLRDKVFVFNDRIYGNGTVKFRFDKGLFFNSPQIGF
jgi:hypothetical protein